MTRPGFEDRRLSFGAEAAAYAEHRPGYPDEAVAWVLGGATRDVGEVADVGAGAGALTAALVRRGLDVTAYDADGQMLAELERRVPGVPTRVAPAESLPLGDAAVDALLVAQAWHWFDQPAAAAEFVRVVRPGGVIGLLWNVRRAARAARDSPRHGGPREPRCALRVRDVPRPPTVSRPADGQTFLA